MTPKTFSNSVINKIIRLRTKDRYTIKKISEEVKLTKVIVSTILSDILKYTSSKYSTTHNYVSKEDVEIIVELRKKSISLDIIHRRLILPKPIITSILKGELGDKCKQYYSKNVPSHLQEFALIYNKVVLEIQPKTAVISVGDCYSFHQEIYTKVKKFNKYKNSSKLAPIAIYFYLRSRNVFVPTTDFINAADLTREDFRKGIKIIYPLCGKFTNINHKAIIYSLIEKIQEKLDLPDSFGNISRAFFNRFGHLLMNTKPEITAGVVCILSLLKLKIHSVTLLTICKTLGFQMSAALYQVKNNLLNRIGIKDFHGFKKTPELVESILQEIPYQVSSV